MNEAMDILVAMGVDTTAAPLLLCAVPLFASVVGVLVIALVMIVLMLWLGDKLGNYLVSLIRLLIKSGRWLHNQSRYDANRSYDDKRRPQ